MSQAKRAAGLRAADMVESGMRVGLGTGSTVYFALERIAERVREQGLSIVGVPTSLDTERKAREMHIPLVGLEQVEALDLTIDGADEIDGRLDMIKGGGGALLREKVVATLTRREVIVVDREKVVERLGLKFLLPVEVVPFARPAVRRALEAMGVRTTLRLAGPSQPYLTDNGNEILDCGFAQGIECPGEVEQALDRIPGVVETGLFVGLAHALVIGEANGRTELKERR